jgi:hypothetical protein
LTFNRLHDVISQKIVLFTITAVGTSNATKKTKRLKHENGEKGDDNEKGGEMVRK